MAASHSEPKSQSPDAPAPSGDYSGPERRQTPRGDHTVEPVILTKKYADALDGIELADVEVGDRLCLTTDQAALIVAEGWARPAERRKRRRR